MSKDQVLPVLEDGDTFVCNAGCGSVDPQEYRFEYSREETPEGALIESKTCRAYRCPHCCADIGIFTHREDWIDDPDDYGKRGA